MARLVDLDLAGESDIAFSDLRDLDLVRAKLQKQHRLRVNVRNRPLAILMDVSTAIEMEREYQEALTQYESLLDELRKAADRADDEALAALVSQRISTGSEESIVSGPEAAAAFRRLYDEDLAR